jgi:hypothetical protein
MHTAVNKQRLLGHPNKHDSDEDLDFTEPEDEGEEDEEDEEGEDRNIDGHTDGYIKLNLCKTEMTQVTCFRCHRTGHFARDCKVKLPGQRTYSPSNREKPKIQEANFMYLTDPAEDIDALFTDYDDDSDDFKSIEGASSRPDEVPTPTDRPPTPCHEISHSCSPTNQYRNLSSTRHTSSLPVSSHSKRGKERKIPRSLKRLQAPRCLPGPPDVLYGGSPLRYGSPSESRASCRRH